MKLEQRIALFATSAIVLGSLVTGCTTDTSLATPASPAIPQATLAIATAATQVPVEAAVAPAATSDVAACMSTYKFGDDFNALVLKCNGKVPTPQPSQPTQVPVSFAPASSDDTGEYPPTATPNPARHGSANVGTFPQQTDGKITSDFYAQLGDLTMRANTVNIYCDKNDIRSLTKDSATGIWGASSCDRMCGRATTIHGVDVSNADYMRNALLSGNSSGALDLHEGNSCDFTPFPMWWGEFVNKPSYYTEVREVNVSSQEWQDFIEGKGIWKKELSITGPFKPDELDGVRRYCGGIQNGQMLPCNIHFPAAYAFAQIIPNNTAEDQAGMIKFQHTTNEAVKTDPDSPLGDYFLRIVPEGNSFRWTFYGKNGKKFEDKRIAKKPNQVLAVLQKDSQAGTWILRWNETSKKWSKYFIYRPEWVAPLVAQPN